MKENKMPEKDYVRVRQLFIDFLSEYGFSVPDSVISNSSFELDVDYELSLISCHYCIDSYVRYYFDYSLIRHRLDVGVMLHIPSDSSTSKMAVTNSHTMFSIYDVYNTSLSDIMK